MYKLLTVIQSLFMVLSIQAQIADPVHFSSQLRTGTGTEGEIVFTATIDPGWHVYSTDLGSDGPIEASFHATKMVGVETVGRLQAKGSVIKKYDEMFGMELKYFEGSATFVQKIRFTQSTYDIDCYLEYGACNDQSCLPPSTCELKQQGKSPLTEETGKTEGAAMPEGDGDVEASEPPNDTVTTVASVVPVDSVSSLWQPVVEEMKAKGEDTNLTDHSLLYLLFMGFVGGLLAVCMPCIWPVIPMTVSFFLKRGKTGGKAAAAGDASRKRKGVGDAIVYGLSIIVIYLGMGLLVTALFGSDTLNAMSTNAFFNVFLCLLLILFALSFFGWFEIKLPDSWATAVDAKADSFSLRRSRITSYLSIFLMAFTLVLVSFSCTAPIIGLLLVETATSGNWLAPAVGMLGFAVALALPFTLFALFPSWLKSAPKSGSWMNTLKVVLGFIELAFALKFFSVADLAYGWHLLDREVFLSLWIAIFGLLGAYLCGWLRFQSDGGNGSDGTNATSKTSRTNGSDGRSVVCIMGGLVSFAFAIYLVPGLWGAPCKAVSAFAPPMSTQDFRLGSKVVEAHYTDYEAGMAAARAMGKPVLLDFTGYGCVNCRKMEAAVWTDPRVADLLTNDVVLISLYVDDKTPLAVPLEVSDGQENGSPAVVLRTVGAKWSWLQRTKFGANAQPFYVMVDPATGRPLTGSRAYDEDVEKFVEFLREGCEF